MTQFYANFSNPADAAEQYVSYGAALQNLQVLSVSGADAIEFLHRQLTQDVRGLGPHTASPAGYCSIKGRLLATLVIWTMHTSLPESEAEEPCIQALVRSDLATSLMDTLNKFVLRSKVKLALTPHSVMGVWTPTGATEETTTLEAALGSSLPRQPWQHIALPCGTWIAAPSATRQQRWWWITSAQQLEASVPTLHKALRPGALETWQAAEFAAGIPWIGIDTQNLFIPQTVNLDLIGGVNFTKGCYPGQEVVARSHYRGKIKRRMAYGVIPDWNGAPIPPGTDIFVFDDPSQPCGRVIDAVNEASSATILFENRLETLGVESMRASDVAPMNPPVPDASSEIKFRLGSATGSTIKLRALPYAIHS